MFKYIIIKIFSFSRIAKLGIISILDLLIILSCSYLSLTIRFDEINLFSLVDEKYLISLEFFLIPITVYFLFAIVFKFYSLSFRFYNLGYNFYASFFLAGVIILVLNNLINEYYSNGAVFINIILIFISIIISRKLISKIYTNIQNVTKIKSLIVCSSKSLHKIYQFLKLNQNISIKAIFVEDLNKIDFSRYQSYRIKDLKNLNKVCKQNKIKEIYTDKFYKNFNKKSFKNIKIQILDTENLFKNIEIDLKQKFVDKYFNSTNKVNLKISNQYNNKTILITGAGGSIGKNLFYELLNSKPKKIILVEQDELKLFNVKKYYENLKFNKSIKLNVSFKLGNLANEFFLKKLFLDDKKIEIVIHAAAYKHVGFGEENIFSFVKNNILVTYDLAKISIASDIKKFIFISTDKAVNPISVMGYSKRICEKILIYLNKKNNLKNIFKIVRFGNVINSDGSVLPIFEKQILSGGPLTVTDKNVTRYFMSITNACQLVLHTIEINKKIGIFVLDMGKAYKILNIAKSMIDFYFKNKRIIKKPKIIFIGLQEGEKIYEELVLGNNLAKTKLKNILSANEIMNTKLDYSMIISKLKNAYIKNNKKNILRYIKNYV